MANNAALLTELTELSTRLVMASQAASGPLPDGFYHYTSSRGLKGILKSRRMRATHVRFLNDESEWEYAYRILREVLDAYTSTSDLVTELIDSLRQHISEGIHKLNLWVVCFCAEGNLLSMWRNYSGEGGYSLDFDPEMYIMNPGSGDVAYVRVRLLYDEDEQKALLTELLDIGQQLASGHLLGKPQVQRQEGIDQIAATLSGWLGVRMLAIKHPAFREEREWRYVILGTRDRSDLPFTVQYRPSDWFMIPYIEVEFRGRPGRNYDDDLPLRSVWHGPTRYPQETKAGLTMFLEDAHFEHVTVDGSDVPLRI
jgi:Protein of unknown function (DUF2971)